MSDDEPFLSHTIEGVAYGEVKMCNCASCGRELLGESMRDWFRKLDRETKRTLPPMIHVRLFGRPYCRTCYANLGVSDLADYQTASRLDS